MCTDLLIPKTNNKDEDRAYVHTEALVASLSDYQIGNIDYDNDEVNEFVKFSQTDEITKGSSCHNSNSLLSHNLDFMFAQWDKYDCPVYLALSSEGSDWSVFEFPNMLMLEDTIAEFNARSEFKISLPGQDEYIVQFNSNLDGYVVMDSFHTELYQIEGVHSDNLESYIAGKFNSQN